MIKQNLKLSNEELMSKDILANQKEKLKEVFPEVFHEGKINLDKLKKILGESVEESSERYEMTWAGKSSCYKEINSPSIGTLKPEEKDSVNFNDTENIFIEGDNLEVLKLLQKSYYEKIKMIYIDPPYNTGKDFVYRDKFGQELDDYLQLTGQVDKDGKRLSTNTDMDGRYHSNWMNMIYPRLFLARNLLREDGVILISINEIEFSNLRKICDEVFGEENYVGEFIWMKGKEGGNDNEGIGMHHEFILVYSKNFDKIEEGINLDKKDTSRHISEIPEKNLVKGIKEEYKKGEMFQLINLSKQKDYRVKIPLITGEVLEWDSYCPQKTIDNYISLGKLFVGQKKVPYVKSFLSEEKAGQKPSSIIDSEFGTTKAGSIEIRELFGSREVFSYPKPSKLIRRLASIFSKESDIILDFFAGSGTTAHAILDLNKGDNGNRKFICVQLPEPTSEDSEAFKSGYKNIAEISKERIRRVIKQIKAETKDSSKQKKLGEERTNEQDLGFKVFKLDKSNFKLWDGNTKLVQTALEEHVNNIQKEAKQEDILYELIIKSGLELTCKVEEIKIANKKVYSIEDGIIFICLEKELTKDLIKGIADKKPSRFYCLDEGFKGNDQLKANAIETFKNIKTVDGQEVIFRTV